MVLLTPKGPLQTATGPFQRIKNTGCMRRKRCEGGVNAKQNKIGTWSTRLEKLRNICRKGSTSLTTLDE